MIITSFPLTDRHRNDNSTRRDEPLATTSVRRCFYHKFKSEFDRPKKGFPELKEIMGDEY